MAPTTIVTTQTDTGGGNAPLALLFLLVLVLAWFGGRALVRRMGAARAEKAIHGNFADYALEALANAAKVDGRIAAEERTAIASAFKDITGAEIAQARVDVALAGANLSKNDLVAYLAANSGAFTREQKVALLKGLLAVFAADGRFDEAEHAALIDYTAAVGFDRHSAPDMLRGLTRDFTRGNIT